MTDSIVKRGGTGTHERMGPIPVRTAVRKARASCPSFLGVFLCKTKVCIRTLVLTCGFLPREGLELPTASRYPLSFLRCKSTDK